MKTGTSIRDGADAVLDNHYVVRDGSWWICLHCPKRWPFPSPVPKAAGPCTPRRWGDTEHEPAVGRPAPEGRR